MCVRSLVEGRIAIVLDTAQVVSRSLQLCNPDLDMEPCGILLLQLAARIHAIEEGEQFSHVAVDRLRQTGDATLSSRVEALGGCSKPIQKDACQTSIIGENLYRVVF